MSAVLEKIRTANDVEINGIIHAVQERYKHISPEWDVVYMAIPKGDAQKRKAYLQAAFHMLDSE